MKDSLINQLR